MTNIKNIDTQIDKNNTSDHQSELFPMKKENEQHKTYTHEQWLYVEGNLETASVIYTISTLTKSEYSSGDTTHTYSLISLPNGDMALVQLIGKLGVLGVYDWETSFNLISYITQFSSQNLITLLKILLKHEKEVISNQHNDIFLENDFMARCAKDQIYELNLQIKTLTACVNKIQNHWLYSLYFKLKSIFGSI